MSVLDLYGEADRIDRSLTADPTLAPNMAGLKIGSVTNVMAAPLRGAYAGVEGFAKIAGSMFPTMEEAPFTGMQILPRQEDFFQVADEAASRRRAFAPLDPSSLGIASKVLGAVGELPGMLLFGGAPGLAMTSTVNTGTEMIDAGVDPTTAATVGAATGLANVAMMQLPQAGNTLKETLALIGINPVIGMAQRAATGAGLEAAGYEQQAKSFDPFDLPAILTDAAMGGIFGYLGYQQTKGIRAAREQVTELRTRWDAVRDQLPQDVQDAAHAMGQWFHTLEQNPLDNTTRGTVDFHLSAMAKALDDVAAGRPVDVGSVVKTLFGPDLKTPTAEAFRSGLVDVWNLPDEQADAAMSLVNAVARYKGQHVDDYINQTFAGMENRAPLGAGLFQSAYHGSPYTFDRFSLDKIGTGEGAQAYGYGLYFAGKKEVAEYYRNVLQKSQLTVGGIEIPNISGGHVDLDFLTNVIMEQSNAPEIIAHRIALIIERAKTKDAALNLFFDKIKKLREEGYEKAAEELRKAQYYILKLDIQGKPTGKLYNVELAPEETDYLLWDKPLSEQSEKIKSAINTDAAELNLYFFEGPGPTGEDIYRWIGTDPSRGTKKAASEYLHSIGIRGIKYLDGTSRSAGEGDYNYVIFDDADVTITAMYQGDRGAVSFLNDGKAVLHALSSPDFSTVVHELAHVFRRQLEPEDLKVFAEVYAGPRGTWDRAGEEKFARAFELYLAEGKAPSPELEGLFSRFKTWLTDIYRGIVGSPLDGSMTNAVRAGFDKLLTYDRNAAHSALDAQARKQATEFFATIADLDKPGTTDTTADAGKGGDHGQEEERRQGLLEEEPGDDTTGAGVTPTPEDVAWMRGTVVTDDTPATPDPTTARKQRQQFDPEQDTILEAIAKLGGINKEQAVKEFGALAVEGDIPKIFGKPVFRAKDGGRTLDDMARALAEEGYLPVDEHGKPIVGALEDAINRAMNGEDVYSSKATDKAFDRQADAAEAEYMARHWQPTAGDPLDYSVERILSERGDFAVYTETVTNPDNTTTQRTMTAREVLDAAARELDDTKAHRNAYEAAALCAMM